MRGDCRAACHHLTLGEPRAQQGRNSRPVEGQRKKPRFHTISFILLEQTRAERRWRKSGAGDAGAIWGDFLEEVEPRAGSSHR